MMRIRLAFVLLAFTVPACSDDASTGAADVSDADRGDVVDDMGDLDIGDAADVGADAGGLYPRLDCDPLVPEFCSYPFPSNVYTVVDAQTPTGRRVAFGEELLLGSESAPWDASDGFSAGTPILAYLPGVTGQEFGGPGDIDQSLSDDSATIVLDVEKGELVPHFAEVDVRSPNADQRSTMIRPVVRLADNTRYIVAFRGLRDASGELIDASPAFAALRDGSPSDDPSVDARRQLYDDIFEHLSAAGWDRAEVELAWDFTTASDANNTAWLVHMRDTALALVSDGIEYTIDTVDTDYESETIAFRINGTFRAPNFMTTSQTGSLLVFGDDGLPAVNEEEPWADVPFELLIPQSATAENPAAIIEYGHGLLGEKEQIEASHFRSFMNEYNYAFCATDLIGMASDDFVTIVAALTVGDLAGLQTMFDRLHQGFVNYVLLMRMMTTTFAADETYGQYLDQQSAYYYGISQGGIMGSVFLALSPDVERGALGVMGQPYSLLLFRSVDFNQFLDLIKAAYDDSRERQHLVALLQMLWDRVEPTGYTHHVRSNPLPGTNPKEVLLRAAIGDHQVTTLGAHIMARTLGVPHLDTGLREVWGLETVSSPVSGSLYAEWDFGLPGEPLCNVPTTLCDDPHEYPRRREAARRQLDEFLRFGTATNYCGPGDGDEHQATAEGVCSYPSLSGCVEETEDDTQAPCQVE